MCAKYYENPTMVSKVTAKNVGDVFFRYTVVIFALGIISVTGNMLQRCKDWNE